METKTEMKTKKKFSFKFKNEINNIGYWFKPIF